MKPKLMLESVISSIESVKNSKELKYTPAFLLSVSVVIFYFIFCAWRFK